MHRNTTELCCPLYQCGGSWRVWGGVSRPFLCNTQTPEVALQGGFGEPTLLQGPQVLGVSEGQLGGTHPWPVLPPGDSRSEMSVTHVSPRPTCSV